MDFVQPTREQCEKMFSEQIDGAVASDLKCCLAYALVGYPYLDVVTVERFLVNLSDIENTLYDRVILFARRKPRHSCRG